MENNSVIDDILDECSQLRVLLVGSSRGKAQLLREIFGVNRITRYPPDFSRDEEIYSKENEYFVAHVFDSWREVADVMKRRRGAEPDEVIHCIWHYVDAQDAAGLLLGNGSDQECPAEIRKYGVPIITVFGRFDNIVTRATEIGRRRRLKETLTTVDIADAKQIRSTFEAIQLYFMQYPNSTAIASKAPSSKITFLNVALQALAKNEQAKMLLIIAQRLNPSLKFETAMSLAMKQFLLGTVSTASPLPIPFAGLIGSQAATYMIKQDILRVWNIYDPDALCSGANGQQSLMDTMLQIPVIGAKRLIYMIPVIGQISGIWETPRLARALGGLMIDLTLLMERAFLATMGNLPDGTSPILTPARQGPPETPVRPHQRYGSNGVKTPLSVEVLRNRHELLTSSSPTQNLISFDNDDNKPKTPPRPKPAVPPKPPRPSTPKTPTTVPTGTGLPVLELSTPVSSNVVDLSIRPASMPLTTNILERIMKDYEPIRAAVKVELEDFFNQEGQGLQRSFQKDTVRRKLDEIVQLWRLSQVVDQT